MAQPRATVANYMYLHVLVTLYQDSSGGFGSKPCQCQGP